MKMRSAPENSAAATALAPSHPMIRRRKRSTRAAQSTPLFHNQSVMLALHAVLLMSEGACPIESFAPRASRSVRTTHLHLTSDVVGVSSSRTITAPASGRRRRESRLSVSTIAPPPHHLAWLESQEEDEAEFCQARKWGFSPVALQPFVSHLELLLPQEPQHAAAAASYPNHTAFETCTDMINNKEAWATRYTTVEALRQTFGTNRNRWWGDLDPQTTRRLYKTLLPRALLELYHMQQRNPPQEEDENATEDTPHFSSQDLAPLAYRARVAAKLYARERCCLPARIAANVFDGFRQFCKYGSFQMAGMSYMQIWEKYAHQIMEEEDFEDEDDLTSKICYKILEKSCETNPGIDALVLRDSDQDLKKITRKLERDVFDLLLADDSHESEQHQGTLGSSSLASAKQHQWSIQRYKTIKALLRIKRRMEGGRDWSEDEEHEDEEVLTASMLDAALKNLRW